MVSHPLRRPVVLCVLDGWGCRDDKTHNAIALADIPHIRTWLGACPYSHLDASGAAVGLPKGQMGNSEVGHMSIGAGRVVMQDLPRIDAAIADGSLAENPTFRDFIAKLKRVGGTCHLMGLLSPGGVHSHQDHLATLAVLLAREGIPVWIHAFLDGRDTPPKSAIGFLKQFCEDVSDEKLVRLGSVSGRYYAMDRDKRWERVARAYNAIVNGDAPAVSNAFDAIEAAYEKGVTDEFMEPFILAGYPGIKDEDGIFMGNFRADRARQILRALLEPQFDGFERSRIARISAAAGLTEYADDITPLCPALFPPNDPKNTLGEVVADAGLQQLRIAETEKYAHVTFFLNGGREVPFPGEERILIPSPKVATYDLQPAMSAVEVTDRLVAALDSDAFDLVVVNYANPDMVGHTGDIPAAITAAETIDACLGRLAEAVARRHGVLLITADHGNIEQMRDPETGEPHTAHTTNLVPFVIVDAARQAAPYGLADGILADVAPTILALMGIPQPSEMTGNALLLPDPTAADRRVSA